MPAWNSETEAVLRWKQKSTFVLTAFKLTLSSLTLNNIPKALLKKLSKTGKIFPLMFPVRMTSTSVMNWKEKYFNTTWLLDLADVGAEWGSFLKSWSTSGEILKLADERFLKQMLSTCSVNHNLTLNIQMKKRHIKHLSTFMVSYSKRNTWINTFILLIMCGCEWRQMKW